MALFQFLVLQILEQTVCVLVPFLAPRFKRAFSLQLGCQEVTGRQGKGTSWPRSQTGSSMMEGAETVIYGQYWKAKGEALWGESL